MSTTKDSLPDHGNRLSNEKSPYLLQHADNPVNWHPWGEEVFQMARREDKPIFLSIGYATCHWCHVMAHESFEDAEVAGALNKHFFCIKVDREERPDVDNIYMSACQAMTRGGGWPLSIFMTPQGKPFFAGTYFPKQGRMGMPGFLEQVNRIAYLWQNERSRMLALGEEVAQALQPGREAQNPVDRIDTSILRKGFQQLADSFDPQWGGFNDAPKFPMPHNLTFLMRWMQRSDNPERVRPMIDKTLTAMRNGGIFDQIGFGFHRYSVDRQWLIPHFEKMLYDQALLTIAYLEAYQCLGTPACAKVAREILTYVLRDMTSPEGGFYCAEDADSEGEEGLFYAWKPPQVAEVLGREDAGLFCRFYGITTEGNFENGLSVPWISEDVSRFSEREGIDPDEVRHVLEGCREKLFLHRKGRIHPLKDDKILTSWNGLMIAALAKATQTLGDSRYADAARMGVDFILNNLVKPNGQIFRRFRQGDAAHNGYLDDYANLVWGMIELYEATFAPEYLEQALRFQEHLIESFWDEREGGFFFSGKKNETLIARSKDAYDGAVPSGNSVAILNLLRLARISGRTDMETMVERTFQTFAETLAHAPVAHTQMLGALDFAIGPSREIVITGDHARGDARKLIRTVQSLFLPNKVLVVRPAGEAGSRIEKICPYSQAMAQEDGEPKAYVCEQYACKAPVSDAEELKAVLSARL